MTKVWMSRDLLEYRQEMKETLRQVVQQNYVGGIRTGYREEPPLPREDLLPPPVILYVSLEGYEGQGDDFIGVASSTDFGIHAMHITILDQQGNSIESGDMFPLEEDPTLWGFLPEAHVPAGTRVIAHITAVDCMGGIGRAWESRINPFPNV